jgi:ankyrin repeat protein
MRAVSRNNLHACDELLARANEEKRRAMLSFKGSRGTPLHLAAACGFDACVRVLLRHGASVAALHRGRTPLHLAAGAPRGAATAVALLLDAGAVAGVQSAADAGEETPLHVAAEREAGAGFCRLLIAHGAAVDAVDAAGFTPLMRAAQRNHGAGAVVVLLAAGADVHVTSRDGHFRVYPCFRCVLRRHGFAKMRRRPAVDRCSTLVHARTPSPLPAVRPHSTALLRQGTQLLCLPCYAVVPILISQAARIGS